MRRFVSATALFMVRQREPKAEEDPPRHGAAMMLPNASVGAMSRIRRSTYGLLTAWHDSSGAPFNERYEPQYHRPKRERRCRLEPTLRSDRLPRRVDRRRQAQREPHGSRPGLRRKRPYVHQRCRCNAGDIPTAFIASFRSHATRPTAATPAIQKTTSQPNRASHLRSEWSGRASISGDNPRRGAPCPGKPSSPRRCTSGSAE